MPLVEQTHNFESKAAWPASTLMKRHENKLSKPVQNVESGSEEIKNSSTPKDLFIEHF